MFDAYMQVRAEHNLDDLPNYVFEEADAVNKCWARGFYGVDVIGRPIYIDCSGTIDVNTLFQVTTNERLMKDRFMFYESVIKRFNLACSALYDRQIS
jgi:hypothetical protein